MNTHTDRDRLLYLMGWMREVDLYNALHPFYRIGGSTDDVIRAIDRCLDRAAEDVRTAGNSPGGL